MSKEVIIIGAGGHGKVIADIIEQAGDSVSGFLDDDSAKKTVGKYSILGTTAEIERWKEKYFIIAVGNNEMRNRIRLQYPNLKYYTAIHPCAVIAHTVSIGEGSCIMAGAVVNADAVIGAHCIINTNAVVEHECCLGNCVHISPQAVLCGNVQVGNGTHIGAGAVVRNNLKIMENCVIGMGAAVVKDILRPGIYIGVPAKRI